MTLATLHIIPYLSWEREGTETFETSRAQLLDIIANLLQRMNSINNEKPLSHVLIGGQTVILEDLASVRPDLLALLVINNARGRLLLGPWYVPVDESLVSGESLLRNLLAARADTRQHGISLLNIAYLPEGAAHTAQLPQILRGFGMDSVLMRYSAPVAHLPFRWQAPDGSSVLGISHDFPREQSSLADQKAIEPDGPLLWMQSVTENGVPPAEDGIVSEQRALGDYIKALRKSLPDALRPALHGELRLNTLRPYAFLLPGTLSTRIYLKQANARQQARLTHTIEPLLSIALTHGTVSYAENLRALLAHAWRTLIRNQSRNRLGGCSTDRVHEANESRFREVEDSGTHVLSQALKALYGDMPIKTGVGAQYIAPLQNDETYLVVWNPHGRTLRQVVEVDVTLPDDKHPAYLITPDGEETSFGWNPTDKRLSFMAEVPPVGYCTYRLQLSDKPTPVYLLATVMPSALIGNGLGETLWVEDERLNWKRGETIHGDLLRFFDGGDAGDAYNYSPPQPDVMVQGVLGADTQIESTPTYQRLIMRYRMRIAPALRANRGRDRGLKTLELTTTATFYDGMAGVYFNVAFVNSAADHRLRAHLRTEINSSDLLTDAAFALAKHPAHIEGEAYPTEKGIEGVINTYPMHTLAAVESEGRAMALLSRGLHEVEALTEHKQTTLALTILRAVGWLSRDDLITRTAAIKPPLETIGAQCLRPMEAEFALVPMSARDPAGMLAAGQAYNAPLSIFQYTEPPKTLRQSYLTLETTTHQAATQDVLLTSLKPPQVGQGWIVRLLNPTERVVETTLTTTPAARSAQRVTLAEESQADLPTDKTGKIKVQLEPHKLVTLRLGFE